MITPEQARPMCKAIVEKYVKDCGCETPIDVACVLTGLASMCSMGISAAIDHGDAAFTMLRIAEKHTEIHKQEKEAARVTK